MTPLRLERFLTGPECHDKALVEQVLSMSNDLGGATLRAQICATTPRKDLTDALRQLEIPIHCIAAEHDQIAPAKPISDFCAGTRHIRQSRIDGTAHMMLLTKPREVADALMA